MSASLENEPDSATETPILTPKVSAAWALRWSHIAIALGLSIFFLLFSYLPLRGTDLWGHTLFGQWILDHGKLPTEDPYFPLAEGMPVIDSAWLAQVVFAFVNEHTGANGLSILFATMSFATLLILARTFYLQSSRVGPMVIGVLCALVIGWSRATTLRPESFGALLFATLLWLLAQAETDPSLSFAGASRKLKPLQYALLWLGVPLVFVLWANFHGSYLCGLILLGCCALGRAIDVAWETRSGAAILRDGKVQKYAFLTELALLATFINPYGVGLLVYNLRFSQNVNLAAIVEWQPLVIMGVGGVEFFLSWIVLLIVWRHSKARISAMQILAIGVFGLLSIKSVRMIGWYAPVFAWAITPHVAEIWGRLRPAAPREDYKFVAGRVVMPKGQSFQYTLICGLIVWLGFAFSPLGSLVLGSKPRTEERLYDQKSSPEKVTAYLLEHPPQGQVFHPQHWGDWFVMRLRMQDEPKVFQPFVTSNIHLAPKQVWDDYLRISNAQPGWQRVLDRYHVTTLVVDKLSQPILAQALRQATEWKQVYDDDAAIVYVRAASLPKDAQAPPPAADEKPGDAEPTPSGVQP